MSMELGRLTFAYSTLTPGTGDCLLPQPLPITRTCREAPGVVTIELTPPAAFSFAAGQFNMLYAFLDEVVISLSVDSGNVNRIVHTVRAVSSVSAALTRLRSGTTIGSAAPMARLGGYRERRRRYRHCRGRSERQVKGERLGRFDRAADQHSLRPARCGIGAIRPISPVIKPWPFAPALKRRHASAGTFSSQSSTGLKPSRCARNAGRRGAQRTVVIFDDLISTGGTLQRAARRCHAGGATRIFAAATHGLFHG